jgi:hypothetical protein
MKKTLLIAAAALAAGVISSQAQVYSQNVVGYINQPIPADSYQIIGSQLINGSDANQTNGDVNAVLVNGFVSSPSTTPSTSTNSQLIYWNGTGFSIYYFYNSNDASTMEGDAPGTDPAGWYDKNGTYASIDLGNLKSVFIYNHSSAAITVTTVGTVFQGSNSVSTINTGYNLINLSVPIATNLVNSTGYSLPLGLTSNPTTSPTITSNDELVYWNGTGYSIFYYYNSNDASTMEGDAPGTDPAGFYDKNGTLFGTTPPVNQGFFLHHIGSAITWTNTFSVQ